MAKKNTNKEADFIFISGNTPSSKNGRIWTGSYSIGSKVTMEYYKNSKQQWIDNKDKFLSMLKGKRKPYKIEFTFVRNSKRKFDYINPAQTVQDMMVKYGYLEDDNVTIMIPYFGKYSVDKEGAGVYIRVL